MTPAPRRGRVAVVAGPDPGHAFPSIALAVALHDAGHDVVVATGARWGADAHAAGPQFVPLPMLEADPRDDDIGFRLWGRGREMAPALAELLAPYHPQTVVADAITVPGWFAADLLGVPRIELFATTLQVPSRALPPPGSGLLPGHGPLGRMRDAMLRRLAARDQRTGAAQRIAARRALGLDDDRPPALRLVATLPALEPPRPDWPPRAHVVGPLEWEPGGAELPLPTGPGPLVLVADSSASGPRARNLLDLAAAALPAAGVRVVGARFDGPATRTASVSIGPARHTALLDHVDAVVLPGGQGLLAKALRRGLPVVVVPGPGDQRDNAVRVEALGAGVRVDPRRLDASTLAAAVRRVLTQPSYAAAARRVAQSGRGLGPARAVELVESVLSPEPAGR
ncbi:MAG TPA: nucleotide disphospho-sugar-binding domain-containing protein [Mycobacteriales bacterium]|nr:nucleotide disphospho-sugar-binding domain-containing protein [Mycobacteriales bacterium]